MPVRERTSKFVTDGVTPSPEADRVNAGESSVTYIGRKWGEAVGGWDVVMLAVSKGIREHPSQQPGMKGVGFMTDLKSILPSYVHFATSCRGPTA